VPKLLSINDQSRVNASVRHPEVRVVLLELELAGRLERHGRSKVSMI
jgi:hypothetical protein